MHHRMNALVLTAVLALPATAVFAEESPANKPADAAPEMAAPLQPGGMNAGGQRGGQHPRKGMHAMMMGGMGQMGGKNMVATSDGGVVIMAGNKVIKYDKDLNLVKEVEFKGPSHAPVGSGPAAGAPEGVGQGQQQ